MISNRKVREDGWVCSRFQQNIFRFQITMDQTSIFQDRHGVQQLRCEDFDKLSTQALELILLDEFVKVGR